MGLKLGEDPILTGITDPKEIKSLFNQLKRLLREASEPLGTRDVNWRYRDGSFRIRCLPGGKFWYALDPPTKPETSENRYWNMFGFYESGNENERLQITCEMNVPKEGRNLRIAGRFAIDDQGFQYLLHSGRIGGGRKGIGKKSFLARTRWERLVVKWIDKPKKKTTEDLVICRFGDPRAMDSIYKFVGTVRRFKADAVKRKSIY